MSDIITTSMNDKAGTTTMLAGEQTHHSHSGGTSVSVNGQMTQQHNNAAGTSTRTGATPVTTSNIITEARTESGFPRSGKDIDENCIVKVNGMEGKIKCMIAGGLLQRLPDGSYALPDPNPNLGS